MQVAVIGAGFSGLAMAWHLSQDRKNHITIFDPLDIGQGTSGIAAGLLQPYAGAQAKLNWRAQEGLQATMNLLKVAENAIRKPVHFRTGLLRLAIHPQQVSDFSLCASKNKDVEWQEQPTVKGIPSCPGIFIDNAYVVDCPQYLKGLWMACFSCGVRLEKKAIRSLKELDNFDHIVIAMGAASNALPELRELKITPIKGQILEMSLPKEEIPFPIASQAYLIAYPNAKTCIAGATFEKNYKSKDIDREFAKREILPKVEVFFPSLAKSTILNCRTGIRASTANHRPLAARVGEKHWILTGMGSKGLLYHALYAKELSLQLDFVQ